MTQLIIRGFPPRPHHVEPFHVLHRLVDELPRFGFAEVIKVLLWRQARFVATVRRHGIRYFDTVGEVAFFCRQRIGWFELEDVAGPIPGLYPLPLAQDSANFFICFLKCSPGVSAMLTNAVSRTPGKTISTPTITPCTQLIIPRASFHPIAHGVLSSTHCQHPQQRISQPNLRVRLLAPVDFVIAKLRRGAEQVLDDAAFVIKRFGLLLFSQTLFHRLLQRTQQVFDHPPPAGLNLHRDGHAGREMDQPAVDLNRRAVQADPCRVHQADVLHGAASSDTLRTVPGIVP